MKKLSKINLGQLHKNDMADREMNQLRGGNNCGC
ncbi:rSAM-modified peptide, partial [Bacteroides fragilis]